MSTPFSFPTPTDAQRVHARKIGTALLVKASLEAEDGVLIRDAFKGVHESMYVLRTPYTDEPRIVWEFARESIVLPCGALMFDYGVVGPAFRAAVGKLGAP